MKTDKYLTIIRLGILMGLLGSVGAQADGSGVDAYVMTVYSDVAYGDDILDGQIDRAVGKLEHRSRGASGELAEQVNLCVAYTKAKQLEKAVESCDTAIALSEREARRLERSRSSGRRTTLVASTGRAIALTNRGVLHVIEGEDEKARVLFEMAMLLESREASASANLARLEQRIAPRDS